MPTTIPEVAQALGEVFTTIAEEAAEKTRFVQRCSKMTGADFVQTLTFGWLARPQATLEELAQTAAACGLRITPQGIHKRLTRRASACLRKVLRAAVTRMVTADPVAIPILQRFGGGVWLLDSSTVPLPDALAQYWPNAGPGEGRAGVKLVVRLNLLHGTLMGPCFQAGSQNDQHGELQDQALPAGALHLADMGFFDLERLRKLARKGAFWLTHVQARTRVYDSQGQRWHLAALMANQTTPTVEMSVTLGTRERLPCRLMAQRVPAAVAEQRRERLRDRAKRANKKVSAERLALADWTVYVTNVPAEQLTLAEAMVLGRCRWQIELLFKLWKSEGRIDESRSAEPWAILCEVYAKLLAMVVQHWVLLTSCWSYSNRSLTKASRTVRAHALQLVTVLGNRQLVCRTLEVIRRCLERGCRMNRRRRRPATYQNLLKLTEPGEAA
jgi:hypothetical protein